MKPKKKKSLRTIIIGDVHGCFDELCLLLDKVEYDSSFDRLIFTGDLINKGPESARTLDLVETLNCEMVLGNHELEIIKCVRKKGHYIRPYFESTLREFGHKCDYYIEWMESWPLFIEGEDFLVVHGGLIPGVHPGDSDPEVITRIRTWGGNPKDLNNTKDKAWFDFYEGDKTIIYGHWAGMGLQIREKTIGLDSGCVFGGKLSAYLLPTKEVVQVDALKVYLAP